MPYEIITFEVNGKRYRLKPWLNTMVMGTLWGFMFLCSFLMFFGLFM
ncbi:hypothetical protein [Allobaculum stercoricanis]|nr:hypothetical protein [Allobaculum stercoricanis]